MHYHELYEKAGLSYFKKVNIHADEQNPLGFYSTPIEVTQLLFRQSLKHNSYDWHCAPQKQFIIYLSSQVKIEASGGESKIFKA